MSAARPKASAIICTKGRSRLLEASLSSLAAALGEADELILVESGGQTAEQLLAGLGLARTLYLRVEPPGKCRQLNAGLRRAAGPVVLLTDDDVEVPPHWADEMASCFIDPSVGIACGRVGGLSHVPGAEEAPPLPPGEAPLETWLFAHGAAMAVRRQAALDAGGFDERLGPGTPASGEDHDFVLRVRRRGWRVVIAPGAPAHHVAWRSAEEEAANALSYERGGGAVVGAALRRSLAEGWPLLRRRLSYQRGVFAMNRDFGLPALEAFAGGLAYGLRLAEQRWLGTEGGGACRGDEP